MVTDIRELLSLFRAVSLGSTDETPVMYQTSKYKSFHSCFSILKKLLSIHPMISGRGDMEDVGFSSRLQKIGAAAVSSFLDHARNRIWQHQRRLNHDQGEGRHYDPRGQRRLAGQGALHLRARSGLSGLEEIDMLVFTPTIAQSAY
jgi:hypothetical protein